MEKLPNKGRNQYWAIFYLPLFFSFTICGIKNRISIIIFRYLKNINTLLIYFSLFLFFILSHHINQLLICPLFLFFLGTNTFECPIIFFLCLTGGYNLLNLNWTWIFKHCSGFALSYKWLSSQNEKWLYWIFSHLPKINSGFRENEYVIPQND